jgi:ribose transport system substrate-binding protein
MRLTRLFTLTVLVGLMAVLGACGSSSSDSSDSSGGDGTATSEGNSGVAEAQKAVEAGEQEPKFKAPGAAFDVKPGLEGGTIWFVANGLNFPFSQGVLAGLKDAAATQGMKVSAVDGAGSPAKAANLIQQAIGQKATAIVVFTFPTESVSEPIKSATSAGIPVIQVNDGDPGLPGPAAKAAGVFANVSSCYACGGTQLANLVTADSNGKADILFVEVPDIKTTSFERDAFKKRLSEVCPECTVTVKQSPVAQWGKLQTLGSSALRENPNLTYIIPAVDAMIPLMQPAVYAANAADRVKMASYNATKPVLDLMNKGDMVVGGVGNPEEWIGWGVMDQTLRALSDQEPLADENIPARTFTKSVVSGLDLNAPSITWYGADPGFREGYEALWKKAGN